MADNEKQDIERTIDRARDGVSERIDELDRRLRSSLDVKSAVAKNAPEIIAGGALIGFLAGFGFPKPLRRAVSIGIPLALIAMKFKKGRVGGDGVGADYDEI
jgi:hypothetical protein